MYDSNVCVCRGFYYALISRALFGYFFQWNMGMGCHPEVCLLARSWLHVSKRANLPSRVRVISALIGDSS